MDKRSFLGEFLGTFILTLFGCSSVACAVLFGEYGSIFQVGLVWGLGVTLAVYMTRYLSCAHLNPAVSVAMVLAVRSALDAAVAGKSAFDILDWRYLQPGRPNPTYRFDQVVV